MFYFAFLLLWGWAAFHIFKGIWYSRPISLLTDGHFLTHFKERFVLEILPFVRWVAVSPAAFYLFIFYLCSWFFFFFCYADLSDSDVAEYLNLSFYSLLCVFVFIFLQLHLCFLFLFLFKCLDLWSVWSLSWLMVKGVDSTSFPHNYSVITLCTQLFQMLIFIVH